MANVEKLVVELDAKIDKYVKGMDKANKSTDKVQKSVKKFDLSLIAASVSAGLLTRSLVGMSDIYVSMQNKLRGVTKSTEELNEVTKKLFDIARDSRSDLEATVTLYSRMARATKDLGLSQDELLGVTETFNKAFKLNGSTAEEAASSITQLSQAMSSGVLAGDEFKTVSEAAPIVLDAIAFATGRARGELKKLGSEGKITSEVLVRSMQAYSDHINTEFTKTQATFAESMSISKTNLIELVGELEVSTPIRKFGEAIVTLTENLDTFAIAAGGTLMVVAIAKLQALRVVLNANPLIAAATALSTIAIAIHSIADAALDAKLDKLMGPRTVTDDIQFLTGKLKDLRFEIAGIGLGGGAVEGVVEKALDFVGVVDIEENEKKISKLTEQINAFQKILDHRNQQLKEFGGDFVTSAGIGTGTKKDPIKKKADTVLIDDEDKKEAAALERSLQRIQDRLQASQDANSTELQLIEERYQVEQETIQRAISDEEEKNLALLELKTDYDDQVSDLALTNIERQQEAFDAELQAHKELLDKKIINEDQYQRKVAESTKVFAKNKKGEADFAEVTEMQKLQVARQAFSAAMSLNKAFFEDNKAVNAGLIIADTAAAIMKTMAVYGGTPTGWVSAASIGAMGLVQLANNASSSKGGGSISSGGGGGGISGGGGIDIGGDSSQDDITGGSTATTISSFAESGESGSATVQIDFNADSGGKSDQLLVETLNELHAKGLLDIRQG